MIQLIDRLWTQTKTVALVSGFGMALISTMVTVLLAMMTSILNIESLKGVKS